MVAAIDVKHGTHKVRSICITLVGGSTVDVAWSLNATTLRIPLYTSWYVDTAPDEATAIAQWKASTKPTEWLLIWPEGTFLRWDTIDEILKSTDFDAVYIGKAEALRQGSLSSVTSMRTDLEVAQAEAMPPEDANPRENPAGCMAICIPSLGQVSRLWMANLIQVAIPMGVTATIHVAVGMSVDEARQTLVDRALAMQPVPKYLLFLGDDNLPSPRGIAQLHDVLEAREDIGAVSGLYRLKQEPSRIVAWNSAGCLVEGRDFKPGQVVAVDGTGLDFCLMRTELLRRVPDPKFLTVEKPAGSQTEDSYFWQKVRVSTDMRPYLHTGCHVGHYDAKTQTLY